MKFIYANGESVEGRNCICPDNSVQTFQVSIRSLSGISPSVLQRKIEELYEVVKIEKADETVLVQEVRPIYNYHR